MKWYQSRGALNHSKHLGHELVVEVSSLELLNGLSVAILSATAAATVAVLHHVIETSSIEFHHEFLITRFGVSVN